MEGPLYGNHSLRNLTLQKRILRMCANHGMSNVRNLTLQNLTLRNLTLRNLTLRKRIKKNLKTKFNEQNIHNTKGQIDKGEDI